MAAATLSDLNKIGFIRGYQALADIAQDVNKPVPSPGNIPKILQVHQKKHRPGSRKRHTERTGEVTVKQEIKQINPWEYAGAALFGIPGAIAAGVMATQQGTPETVTVTGPPEAVQPIVAPTGGYTPPSTAGGGFDLGGSLDMVGKIIPLFLVIAVIGAVKKLM